MRFAEDLGVNPDGSIKACELITNEELGAALGGEAEALPLGGLVDSTVGLVLDQRVLPDAPACWIVGSSPPRRPDALRARTVVTRPVTTSVHGRTPRRAATSRAMRPASATRRSARA